MKDPTITELNEKTPLKDLLDSLACVEVIQSAEEELKIELSFEEVRGAVTYWDLQDVLSGKGYGC